MQARNYYLVEIGHDNAETLVLLSDQVLYRDKHIKFNETSSAGFLSTVWYPTPRETLGITSTEMPFIPSPPVRTAIVTRVAHGAPVIQFLYLFTM